MNTSPKKLEQSNDSVIKFPPHKIVRVVPPKAMEQQFDSLLYSQIEGLVTCIAIDLERSMMRNGVSTKTDGYDRHFSFVIDNVRALLYRQMGKTHPIHELIDNSIQFVDTPEELGEDMEIEVELDDEYEEDDAY